MDNTTRRKFMQAAGAAVSAPVILGAASKSGSAKPILGEGDHKYEVTHDWGELPANIKYGNTHGVCEDSQGHIYVHHTVNAASESHDTMVVYDAKGKFVRSWGKEFIGGAHGLTLNKEGKDEFLYLCDTKRGLMVKATLKGETVFQLEYPKESEAYKPGPDGKPPKYSPTNLAIAPNGDIYIGDGYGSSYINQYNKKGEYIRTFGGGKTKKEGDLNCPHGIVMDRRGAEPMLLVADRTNKRLQYFTLDGKFHSFAGGVKSPCHFDQFKNGDLLIPDLEARVTLLDKNNQVVLHLGEDTSGKERELRKMPRESFIPGKFICPHGACFDHKGNIFVVEWVEVGRVSKLRKVA
jgi:sugar lactone lactonase YvrE